MMNKTLRLLIVDDSEDDATLMLWTLKREGYNCISKVVDQEEEFRKALQEGVWDIVICDYSLPRFNGIKALQILKEKGLDIPFILVSGVIGEETAVDALKAGAWDFVLKDRLTRLAPVVERSLREAEHKRKLKEDEELLRKAYRDLETIFKAIGYPTMILDTNYRILDANRVVTMITGLEKEELVGQYCYKVFYSGGISNSSPPLNCPMRELLSNGGRDNAQGEVEWKVGYFIVNCTPVFDDRGEIEKVIHVATDITERKEWENERKATIKRTRDVLIAFVNAMASAVEKRDPYTFGHQRRVAKLAQAIAESMDFPRDMVDGIYLAGLVHDIGKISVPSEILSKPSTLTEIEFQLIKTHPGVGWDILKNIDFPWPIARIILEHHERIDGSGYPNGIKGEEILIEARILAVADVVEAMVSHRSYRPALGIEEALLHIMTHSGSLYDPRVVDACVKLFREGRFHFD
ncbi:MAG: HD domain-containing protein [Syntrophales bacterium]|nr:HD domain-containing protein [Syntrophales bacterium]